MTNTTDASVSPAGELGPVSPAGELGPVSPAGELGPVSPAGELGPLSPTGEPGPISPAPRCELAYEAIVDIAPREALGRGPLGERFIVPILGGRFAGPRLCGEVLAGGADRQLLRDDGIRELDAFYEMRTDDGTVLTVRNRAIIDAPADGARYAFSRLVVTAPQGPHAWLNRRLLVGTVDSLQPRRMAVRIRVYELA